MVIGSPGYEVESVLDEAVGERLCVADDLTAVVLERRLERLLERHRLGSDDVLERTTLGAREHRLVDCSGVLLLAENEAAARTAQSLVRGARHGIRVWNRRRVVTRGNQTGEVRHVDHELGANLLRHLGKRLELDDTRIGAGAGDDHLRLLLARDLLHARLVDSTVVTDTVVNRVIEKSGEVDR